MAHERGMESNRGPNLWEIVGVAIVLLTSIALHAGSIARPFFADDYLFLEQVRGHSLSTAMMSPDPIGNFLRPVSRALYFWTMTRVGGETPALFHAVGLVIFIASLLLLYAIARRLAGGGAAFFALAFVALHYAADVPLSWASGSQDLLAVFFATVAIYLHSSGRRIYAPLALALAMLSKESVAGAALIAILADHRPSESWTAAVRRGLGLVAVTLAWAAWWVASKSAHPLTGHTVAFEPGSVAASLVHALQTALSLEFRAGGNALGHWSALALLPGAIAAALVLWLAARTPAEPAPDKGPRAVRLGIAWAGIAVVPVMLVMPIWSAYFYLWALFGLALAGGALAMRLPPSLRAATLGTLVALSANARLLDEFAVAGGSWAWQSHVNRHYVDRSLVTIERYLSQLRSARPKLARRTTIFFANIPPSSGWQAGDGPLVRWAYRDSSLRSYYLTQFSKARASRGPVLFFAVEDGSLKDKTSDGQMLPSFAFSMILAEKPLAAVDALDASLDSGRAPSAPTYWRGLARIASGDTVGGRLDLQKAGMDCARVLPPGSEQAVANCADTSARILLLTGLRGHAVLNPWVHARLTALLLARGDLEQGAVEAYAYRVLAPEEPDAWRKWAAAQLAQKQYEPALASLEHYIALSGSRGQLDGEAQKVADALRRTIRGDLAHKALRTTDGS